MKIPCANGNVVDHWYDRRRRESVTRVNDAAGNQIGNAQHAGNRVTARANRDGAVKANGGRARKII